MDARRGDTRDRLWRKSLKQIRARVLVKLSMYQTRSTEQVSQTHCESTDTLLPLIKQNSTSLPMGHYISKAVFSFLVKLHSNTTPR